MPDLAIMVTILFITSLYFIIFLILFLVSKGRSKKEFLILLAIVTLPINIVLIDILT